MGGNGKLLEVSVVAQRLSMSENSVYQLFKARQIAYIQVAPRKGYRVEESELNRFINSRRVAPSTSY
jgi:hypothetical protein